MKYIGEIDRMIATRIKEHIKRSSSAVFQHMIQHDEHTAFQWRLLHRNVKFTNQRRILEGMEISRAVPTTLMNGCTGAQLTFNPHI